MEEGYREDMENITALDTNSTIHQCPSWYLPTSTGCICGTTRGPLIRCVGLERVRVEITYCMSFDEDSQQTLVGKCPYVNKDKNKLTFVYQTKNTSHLNEELCGWANRTGFLCSSCKDGLGVAAMTYDYKCVKCIGKWKGWILYFFVALTPVTLFFFFIIIFRIRTTSEKMNTMVCILQVIIFYIDKNLHTVQKSVNGRSGNSFLLTLVTFVSIWNLDFFRHVTPPFCISEELSILTTIAMDYIVAFYPFLLTFLAYVCSRLHRRGFKLIIYLWMPFKWSLNRIHLKIDVERVTADVLATFLQLSYSKIIFVSFSLLAYVTPFNAKGESVYPVILYYDSKIAYLSRAHFPYFVLSAAMLVIFAFFPMVLLFISPMQIFQRFCPKPNWLNLDGFVESFNVCYKDGTGGTKDYRFFGGFF